MTTIWTVRELIKKLENEYDSGEQIVFTFLAERDVANILRVGGGNLQNVMFHLQRVIDGLDSFMGQPLSLAVSEARLEDQDTAICLLCQRRGDWASVRPNIEDRFMTLTFCGQCLTLEGIFKNVRPENCNGKWIITSDLFSEFLRLPFHTIKWEEFIKPVERKLWRALVRVISLSWSDDTVTVMAPSWHTDKHATTRLSAVPTHIRNKFEPDFRCHAQVNTGTEQPEDLIFVNWETI